MRPSTGYKIIGSVLIAAAVIGIVLALFGQPTGGAGLLVVLIGFLLYRRGMRLALQEHEPQQRSVYLAMFVAWWCQLARRLRGHG